ncbi:MAG: hypothetical protein GW858_08675 [Sphingomonadales bacterium]|nr:hypothetical protein [Sphingomonadales bacterium]NCQ21102.1 hypothetical protein [Sphingomonadales bacterium]
MARGKASTKATTTARKVGESRMPSPNPITNMVIADVVLRGASVILRRRVEKGMLKTSFADDHAKKLVDKRGVVSTFALWGASRLAMRSPIGLAVVVGGFAAKVFYDRGKQLESKPRFGKRRKPES